MVLTGLNRPTSPMVTVPERMPRNGSSRFRYWVRPGLLNPGIRASDDSTAKLARWKAQAGDVASVPEMAAVRETSVR